MPSYKNSFHITQKSPPEREDGLFYGRLLGGNDGCRGFRNLCFFPELAVMNTHGSSRCGSSTGYEAVLENDCSTFLATQS